MQETKILLEQDLMALVNEAKTESIQGWRTINIQMGVPTAGGAYTNAMLMVREIEVDAQGQTTIRQPAAPAPPGPTEVELQNSLPPDITKGVQHAASHASLTPLQWITAVLGDALDERSYAVRMDPGVAAALEGIARNANQAPEDWAGNILTRIINQAAGNTPAPTPQDNASLNNAGTPNNISPAPEHLPTTPTERPPDYPWNS